MRVHPAVPIPPAERLRAFCERWQVVEVALFGSAVREDFGPHSDIDVLLTFAPQARYTLLQAVYIEDEVAALFGRPVDVVDRQAVEESQNYIRRREILRSAVVIHAQR